MRRPVDWPEALQSLSGFLKKSWRAPMRHHSTCSVIKRGCHLLLHILYWRFIGECYILKLDEANERVLWFRKLNLNYLWDLIQKLNPIYILDLILANSQLWRSGAGSIYLGLCSLPRTNISLFSNERTNCFIFRKQRGSNSAKSPLFVNDLQNKIWTKMFWVSHLIQFYGFAKSYNLYKQRRAKCWYWKILLQPFLINPPLIQYIYCSRTYISAA